MQADQTDLSGLLLSGPVWFRQRLTGRPVFAAAQLPRARKVRRQLAEYLHAAGQRRMGWTPPRVSTARRC